MKEPIVSVKILTYNHSQYINQCIESVLMQKTNFQFEIVIGEDCSKDGTREICQKYTELYPNIVKLIISDSNVGISENSKRTYEACKGKYIAFCEGDDYWIDPYKLQKQVSFLENNIDYSLCFHNAFIENLNNPGKVSSFPIDRNKNVFTTKDIFKNKWFIPTASIVCRTKYLPLNIKDVNEKFVSGDMLLQLIQSKYGKIYCFREFMSVYRFGTKYSVTKQNSIKSLLHLKKYVDMLNKINIEVFDGVYTKEVLYRKRKYYLSVVKYYLLKIFHI